MCGIVGRGSATPPTTKINIATMKVIILVMVVEVDLGHKRPATLPLATMEFIILVLMVEVEIGIDRPRKIISQLWIKSLCLRDRWIYVSYQPIFLTLLMRLWYIVGYFIYFSSYR